MSSPCVPQVHTAISLCDPELRAQLYSCVVLSGGSMSFPGMEARLGKELNALIAADEMASGAGDESGERGTASGSKASGQKASGPACFGLPCLGQPQALPKFKVEVRVSRPASERKQLAYLGGGMLGCSLHAGGLEAGGLEAEVYDSHCILRQEYIKTGPSVVHHKC